MTEVFDRSRHGNVVVVQETPAGRRALKVYRRRRGWLREALGRVSHRLFEGKRSPSALARWETERSSIQLWSRHGFDVPGLIDAPPPPELEGELFSWFEFVPGRPLFWHLVDPEVALSEKLTLARQLGRDSRRRHALALELNEPLLLHEHPTTKHVLVSADRLVTIDLEGGYRSDFSPEVAAGLEVAGVVRSLWRDADQDPLSEALPWAYVEGYGDLPLLREVARAAGGGLRGALHRWSDRRRRARPKSTVLRALLCASATCAGPAASYPATC